MEFQRRAQQIVSRSLLTLSVGWLICAGLLIHQHPETDWPMGVLLALTSSSALASLNRSLQLQNVCVAAALILFIASGVIYLNGKTSIPFGPLVYTERAGEQPLDDLPATMPLLWLTVLLTARGVARLILRPWRKVRVYGFQLIGLTCLLTMLFDLGLEAYAAHLKRLWLWQPTAIPFTWHGAPLINCFGWLVTALFILAFVTPWLINKQPGGSRPPDYQPLILWVALNGFLAVHLAANEVWVAAGMVTVQTAISSTLAGRNARW